jgi:NADH dehydrogenase
VQRIVHVSITNPSEESPLEYFSGKARLEQALAATAMSYAILRPTVLFGKEDILINNIAWALRRLPVFGVFGDGHYRLQPIYVDDLAQLAVEQGANRENVVIDAIGP